MRRVLTRYTQWREVFAQLSFEERSAASKGHRVRLQTRRRLATAKLRQAIVTCAACGKAFEIKASPARGLERHTCSPICRRELLRRDARREASREVSNRNLASGRTARWDKQTVNVARRLSALDESTLAVLPEQDQSMISAYYAHRPMGPYPACRPHL